METINKLGANVRCIEQAEGEAWQLGGTDVRILRKVTMTRSRRILVEDATTDVGFSKDDKMQTFYRLTADLDPGCRSLRADRCRRVVYD
jgi:hypothetical protein